MYAAYCASLDHQKRTRDIKEEKKTLSLEAADKKLKESHRIYNHTGYIRNCKICLKEIGDLIPAEVFLYMKRLHQKDHACGLIDCYTCYMPYLSEYGHL